MNDDGFVQGERYINPQKKIQDPAVISTQDLLNTSQTLLPLGHLDPWQRSINIRQPTQAALPRELSQISSDSHSRCPVLRKSWAQIPAGSQITLQQKQYV